MLTHPVSLTVFLVRLAFKHQGLHTSMPARTVTEAWPPQQRVFLTLATHCNTSLIGVSPDRLCHHPCSPCLCVCVQLMWLLGPRGIPADWRHMEGFGVHTFKVVNKAGKETYVKFHWKPTCGVKVLTDEEAKQVGEANNVQSHATEDLWNCIESGTPLLLFVSVLLHQDLVVSVPLATEEGRTHLLSTPTLTPPSLPC